MQWDAGRRPGRLWPLALTLLGAFLRWYRLGDTRVLWDHAYPVAQGMRLLQSGIWPTLGQPTSTFLSNPPGQAYASLLPLLLWNSFWLTFWFITTLNVLAVPLLYRFARTHLGETTAVVATFLFAVSPWVVYYSRASWSSSLLPVGGVLVLGLLLRALAPGSRFRNANMLAMFVSLAVLGQTYFLALVLVPVQAAGVIVTSWRAIPWRGLWAGAAVFALGLGLYGAAIAANLPAQILEARRLSQDASGHATITLQSFKFGLSFVTGRGYFDNLLPPALARALEWALDLAFALGILRAAVRLVRRRQGAWVDGALLMWWAVPVAALSYNNQRSFQWHLLSTLPAGQLLAASGIAWLAELWPRARPGWLAAGAGPALASFSVLHLTAAADAAQPGPQPGARLDVITLNAAEQMGAVLNQAMNTYHLAELYSDLPDVVPTAWTGRPVNVVSWSIENRLLIIPDDRPALYLRTNWGTPPAAVPLSTRLQVVTWPGDAFTALDLIPAYTRAAEAALPQVQLDWPSDTGLTLLGDTLGAPLRQGQTSVVTTYWRIDSLADTRGQFIFGPYLHLVNANGSLAVSVSSPGLPGYYYRQGDLYVETIDVPIPADLAVGTYNLDLGLYDGLHTTSTLFHAAGQADQQFYRSMVVVQ
jgi:hypothetical protein